MEGKYEHFGKRSSDGSCSDSAAVAAEKDTNHCNYHIPHHYHK